MRYLIIITLTFIFLGTGYSLHCWSETAKDDISQKTFPKIQENCTGIITKPGMPVWCIYGKTQYDVSGVKKEFDGRGCAPKSGACNSICNMHLQSLPPGSKISKCDVNCCETDYCNTAFNKASSMVIVASFGILTIALGRIF